MFVNCAKSREMSVERSTVSRQRESPPEIADILKFDWCKIQILTWGFVLLAYLFIHEDGLSQYICENFGSVHFVR